MDIQSLDSRWIEYMRTLLTKTNTIGYSVFVHLQNLNVDLQVLAN